MIAFATLFLGLIIGPQFVEVVVDDSVSSVELLLDGRGMGFLRAEDGWSGFCDFGSELEPHELVAVAYDSERREIARARQWINLPNPPAKATVVFEGGRDGRGVEARLFWESVVAAQPTSVTVRFDGAILRVRDPGRIALPDFDPDQLHFFRAELEFPDNVSSVVEVAFGGRYADQANAELTAVPVELGRRAQLPSVEQMQGWFSKAGEPLVVVATESGAPQIVVVRAEDARRDISGFRRAARRERRRLEREAAGRSESVIAKGDLSFVASSRLRLLSPFPTRQKREGYDLEVFPQSAELTSAHGDVYALLTSLRWRLEGTERPRLADAVAAAALLAAGPNRRRAVILMLGAKSHRSDASQFESGVVRRYLEHLRVPLFVWSTAEDLGELPAAWGEVVDITTHRKLEKAVEDVNRVLERQRIVWIDGTHLLPEVELTPNPAIRLAL
jgi:hypothetical protein